MKHSGLTLIELLVALVILSILIATGVPGMQTLLANIAIRSNTEKLVGSFAYARGEAVARVNNVSVRTNNWADGWTVFLDQNGSCTIDIDDEILRDVDISEEGIAIAANPLALNCVSFNRYGENADTAERTFNFTKASGTARLVRVSNIGYTSID
ncbi:MAG: GspH/FimT family pseudopilin [Pseudomonadota bacterium]